MGALVPLLHLPPLRGQVVTRPGRVEVYRYHTTFIDVGWAWRHKASNGRIVSRSSEAYGRLRDVARSLELAFPGYRLLDQDCDLTGPTWWLYGMEFAHPGCAAEIAIPEDTVMGVGMRGVRIPVTVPAGVWLGSRR